jgi:RNA polymerase sigma-70 factor, ECF subfamily
MTTGVAPLNWGAVQTTTNSTGAGEAWFEVLGPAELGRAFRLACFVLGDARDAEDATQDAISRAWARRDQLRDRERGQAWFDQILVNTCRQRLRQRRPRVRWLSIEPDVIAQAKDPFAQVIARDEVLRALDLLTTEHRLVVVLRYWADLPLEAIAERLETPLGTVKSRLHYALGQLRAADSLRDRS